jgi:hypothetical protein
LQNTITFKILILRNCYDRNNNYVACSLALLQQASKKQHAATTKQARTSKKKEHC